MSAPYRRPVQPLRYRVTFWNDDQPDVSYNCALGTVSARRMATYTARNYGGMLWVEHTDGTSERVDIGDRLSNPVLPSEALKAA